MPKNGVFENVIEIFSKRCIDLDGDSPEGAGSSCGNRLLEALR